MALETNELYSSTTQGKFPRIQPEGPAGVQPKTFDEAAAGEAVVLPVGLPVCYNTATASWVPYIDGVGAGTNKERVIRGFVYPREITIPANGSGQEAIGNVMLRGQISYDDIVAATAAYSTTVTNLATNLRGIAGEPSLRELGLHVQGLDGVR